MDAKKLLRSTSAQINMIVDYMSANKDFANHRGEYSGVQGVKKSNEEWEALRIQLKHHGADKSVQQWKHTWRDLKVKARKALRDCQGQVPVVSNSIFKILETIGSVDPNCSIEIQATASTLNSCDWVVETDDNSLLENVIENNEDEDHMDKESDKSSEPEDVEDRNSVVEVIIAPPKLKEVYISNSSKRLHDPLQAPTSASPRLPRLAPKPSPRPTSTRAYSPYARQSSPHERDQRTSSAIRRRQLLMSRRRKTQNMFQQASNDFVSLEQQRLRMEEERDRRLHEREMERLKLELQRIEVQRNHNELLQHLVNIAQNAYETLQQKLQ